MLRGQSPTGQCDIMSVMVKIYTSSIGKCCGTVFGPYLYSRGGC